MSARLGPSWTVTQDYRGTPNNLPLGVNPQLLIQAESVGNDWGGDKTNYHRQRIVADGVEIVNATTPRSYMISLIAKQWTPTVTYDPYYYGNQMVLPVGPNVANVLKPQLIGKTITPSFWVPEGTVITDLNYYYDTYYEYGAAYLTTTSDGKFRDPGITNDYGWPIIIEQPTYFNVLNMGFDVYLNDSGQVDDLYSVIANLTPYGTYVVLTTYDEPSTHINNNNWQAAVMVTSFNSNMLAFNRSFRDSHLFVGMRGCQPVYESHRPQYDAPITFTGWLA